MCLHKQLIRITKVNLNFWKTVIIVINQITLFQIVFVNTAEIKEKSEFLFSMDYTYEIFWSILWSIEMNNLHPTLWTITHVAFLIQEIVQIQEIDILHIEPLLVDQLQFHGDHKFLVFNMVIVIENSIPIEHQHVQDTLTLTIKKETLDLRTILLSETITIVLFLDPTLEMDSTVELITPHIDGLQNPVYNLHLHLEDLSIICNQIPSRILIKTLIAFQSHKTILKLTCIPVKWQML